MLFTVLWLQTGKMGALYFPFSSLFILVSKRQWMGDLQSLQRVINILPGRRTWKQHVSVDRSNFLYNSFVATRSRIKVSITQGTLEATSWWKLSQLSCSSFLFLPSAEKAFCKERKCSQRLEIQYYPHPKLSYLHCECRITEWWDNVVWRGPQELPALHGSALGSDKIAEGLSHLRLGNLQVWGLVFQGWGQDILPGQPMTPWMDNVINMKQNQINILMNTVTWIPLA